MSAVLKQSLSCAAQLFKPTFYKNVHDKVINNVRTELKNNSIRPIIWVMCIVGTVGYTMEYAIIGSEFLYSFEEETFF